MWKCKKKSENDKPFQVNKFNPSGAETEIFWDN